MFARSRFARFLVIGLLNTVVGYGIYAGLVLLGLDPVISLVAATCVGVVFNFFSTGHVVFQSLDPWAFPRFVLVYAATCTLNVMLLKALIGIGFHSLTAQAASLPFIAVCSFMALRLFVFRSRAHG